MDPRFPKERTEIDTQVTTQQPLQSQLQNALSSTEPSTPQERSAQPTPPVESKDNTAETSPHHKARHTLASLTKEQALLMKERAQFIKRYQTLLPEFRDLQNKLSALQLSVKNIDNKLKEVSTSIAEQEIIRDFHAPEDDSKAEDSNSTVAQGNFHKSHRRVSSKALLLKFGTIRPFLDAGVDVTGDFHEKHGSSSGPSVEEAKKAAKEEAELTNLNLTRSESGESKVDQAEQLDETTSPLSASVSKLEEEAPENQNSTGLSLDLSSATDPAATQTPNEPQTVPQSKTPGSKGRRGSAERKNTPIRLDMEELTVLNNLATLQAWYGKSLDSTDNKQVKVIRLSDQIKLSDAYLEDESFKCEWPLPDDAFSSVAEEKGQKGANQDSPHPTVGAPNLSQPVSLSQNESTPNQPTTLSLSVPAGSSLPILQQPTEAPTQNSVSSTAQAVRRARRQQVRFNFNLQAIPEAGEESVQTMGRSFGLGSREKS